MKANLLLLTLMTLTTAVSAKEQLYVEDGQAMFIAYVNPDFDKNELAASPDKEIEKEMKIANLSKLLDQQQRLYEEKITYLEDELKKSKERLVEKSINHDKMQSTLETRFLEESSYLKKELVAKTKTLMEYQRQLEKIKPSEDMKNLIKANTELAVELRKTNDQMALIQLKGTEHLATKPDTYPATHGRMPASIK